MTDPYALPFSAGSTPAWLTGLVSPHLAPIAAIALTSILRRPPEGNVDSRLTRTWGHGFARRVVCRDFPGFASTKGSEGGSDWYGTRFLASGARDYEILQVSTIVQRLPGTRVTEIQRSAGVPRADGRHRQAVRAVIFCYDQHREFYPLLLVQIVRRRSPTPVRATRGRPFGPGRPGFVSVPDSPICRPLRPGGWIPQIPPMHCLDDGDAGRALGHRTACGAENRMNGKVNRSSEPFFDVSSGAALRQLPPIYPGRRSSAFTRDPRGLTIVLPRKAWSSTRRPRRSYGRRIPPSSGPSYVDLKGPNPSSRRIAPGGKRDSVRPIGDDGVLTLPDFARQPLLQYAGKPFSLRIRIGPDVR